MPPGVLIRGRDLTLGYEGHAVTQNLTFEIREGDYLCVVGDNGSGKSTLIKTLLGLLPPISGTLEISPVLKRTGIGYLPQQTPAQRDFPASVREVVLSGCIGRIGYLPFFRREERQLASDAMVRLGIADLADKCYRELSGGQQQRVLLARAFCATGSMILLDEPTTGLDPGATADLYERIAEINHPAPPRRPSVGRPHLAPGVTVVMVSHDIPAAVHYADKILFLSRKSFFFGTTADYLRTPEGSRLSLRDAPAPGNPEKEADV